MQCESRLGVDYLSDLNYALKAQIGAVTVVAGKKSVEVRSQTPCEA